MNTTGHYLLAGLDSAQQVEDTASRTAQYAEKVNVVGAGSALTAAYEQLRNAAENTEEDLLLQNAIRRLREQLDIKNIVAQHVAQYQELYQGTVP